LIQIALLAVRIHMGPSNLPLAEFPFSPMAQMALRWGSCVRPAPLVQAHLVPIRVCLKSRRPRGLGGWQGKFPQEEFSKF
jgi:hypothetical protein